MHHKRRRAKKQRAGCLMCKFWKMNHAKASWQHASELRQKAADRADAKEERSAPV